MVKLFGVGEDIPEEKQKDNSKEENYNSHEHVSQDDSEEETIGQIALDVLENHESIYILAPVAGIELNEIDISVHETTLTIMGVRKKPKEFYEHSMQVKNAECFWGRFKRSIILPDNMDFSAVKAVMENNLLVVHIPKIRFDSRNIKINRIHS